MLKPLKEEQADMRLRWADPSYQWANDSDLRRKYNARRQLAVPNEVHQSGHNVAQPHSSSSEETETKEGRQ